MPTEFLYNGQKLTELEFNTQLETEAKNMLISQRMNPTDCLNNYLIALRKDIAERGSTLINKHQFEITNKIK